jgi:tetratricopeptide (TPR) repeat protein
MAVSVRGAMCWLMGLTLAGYITAVSALYCWFERRPENLIEYSDTLLLPMRWSHVRELRGRMMIQEGLADFASGRWTEAHLKLRVGLARDPRNTEGRRALARFYQLAGRRTQALTVLVERLAHGYPGRAYLEELFGLAGEGEDYEVILSACERFIPEANEDRGWLVVQRIQTLIAAGRFAGALSATEGADSSAAMREARVLALIELNRVDEALAYLDRWEAESDAAIHAMIVRLRVHALREARQLVAMNTECERLRELEPASSRAYLHGVIQKSLAGQRAESAAALDGYFRRFAASATDLLLAANALASAGDVALVDRCAERAVQQGFSSVAFGLVRLEAQLSHGDRAAAGRTMAEIEPLFATAQPAERYVGTWLQRLLAVSTRADEVPTAALVGIFQERPAPLRLLRVSIEVLVRAERYESALAVLEVAERSYPSSRTLAGLRRAIYSAPRSQSRDGAWTANRAAGQDG